MESFQFEEVLVKSASPTDRRGEVGNWPLTLSHGTWLKSGSLDQQNFLSTHSLKIVFIHSLTHQKCLNNITQNVRKKIPYNVLSKTNMSVYGTDRLLELCFHFCPLTATQLFWDQIRPLWIPSQISFILSKETSM